MNSISFPNIFNSTRTNIIYDHDATLSNLKLMLQSQKTALFGDPYFGTNLQKVIYENNNAILKDLIIDEIYTSIKIFMPQLKVDRSDITVTAPNKVSLVATIKAKNLLNYKTDMYEINLTDN